MLMGPTMVPLFKLKIKFKVLTQDGKLQTCLAYRMSSRSDQTIY